MKWYFSNFHPISTFSSKDVISRAHVVLLEKVSSDPGNEASKSIHYFHIDHNAPCFPPTPPPPLPSKFFITVITVVPREIQDNGYAFFLGGGKVHYGLCYNRELWQMAAIQNYDVNISQVS